MIALYVALGIIGAALLFYFIPTFLISWRIFFVLFVRNNKKKWARGLSWDNEEQQKMFDEGEEFFKENESFCKQISIKSGKYSLVGEYFDFGFDKAVIIIPGRMETCLYSLYFAKPYKESGYNVLAIDNRSHGLSDGRYNTVGLKEYEDIIAWSKKLHDDLGVKEIVYHGLCIGSATALYALTSENAPDYAKALIAEGMYTDFRELFKNQLIARKKPLFPAVSEVMCMLSVVSGKNVAKNGPISCIGKMKRPVLFVYGKKDVFSTPEIAEKVYSACSSKKRLTWFDEGVHSHLRINAPEKYDNEIKEFLKNGAD